jgi:UDP-N-acetylmuramate dehydrogenase
MDIRHGVALKDHSTFHIGGPAEAFTEAATKEALRDAIAFARASDMPWYVIGEGSNMLFADEGVRGLVIKNAILGISWKDEEGGTVVRAGAGMNFDEVVASSVARGLWGLENLSHIPGSIGATPVQNVGAYGVEVASLIRSVEVYDVEADAFRELGPDECAFGYRDSHFKREPFRYAIVGVSFFLPKDAGPKLGYRDLRVAFEGVPQASLSPRAVREAVIRIRAGKFPDWRSVGTAGSFFKNPIVDAASYARLRSAYPDIPGHPQGEAIKVPLGWILDRVCGMRGMRLGLVRAYEHQALVIVAEHGARAADVIAFSDMIASRVHDATNIRIEREVTYRT